ncbi:hypothetical protein Mapa_006608 [Marchantia paleacea]|nr:hypothetical protein Mapa_006608 [Marchantia paleacea]
MFWKSGHGVEKKRFIVTVVAILVGRGWRWRAEAHLQAVQLSHGHGRALLLQLHGVALLLQLSLQVVLVQQRHAARRCITGIRALLEARDGIRRVGIAHPYRAAEGRRGSSAGERGGIPRRRLKHPLQLVEARAARRPRHDLGIRTRRAAA